MESGDDLRNILKEIKREKWKEHVSEDEYTTNNKILDEIREKNLEILIKRNKAFKLKQKRTASNREEKKLTWGRVSKKAREAYEKWKKENPIKIKECPEVPVQNLLYLIHYLNSDLCKENKSELEECLTRQNSTFEVFWDSPSCILEGLRQCLLNRDWQNMTYLLLILLNYDKKYLPVIKNMCKIMLKCNPLIKQSGLEEQFRTLFENSLEEVTVV